MLHKTFSKYVCNSRSSLENNKMVIYGWKILHFCLTQIWIIPVKITILQRIDSLDQYQSKKHCIIWLKWFETQDIEFAMWFRIFLEQGKCFPNCRISIWTCFGAGRCNGHNNKKFFSCHFDLYSYGYNKLDDRNASFRVRLHWVNMNILHEKPSKFKMTHKARWHNWSLVRLGADADGWTERLTYVRTPLPKLMNHLCKAMAWWVKNPGYTNWIK